MRLFFISLVLFLICSGASAQNSVFFGEACATECHTEEVTKIFLDKNGHYYPSVKVPYQEFSMSEFSIKTWYENSSELAEGRAVSFEEFQTEVISQNLKEITATLQNSNKKVVVLIHGFRKPYKAKNGDKSSVDQYEIARSKIKNSNPLIDYHFIEVYWDGTYMAPERSLKFAIKLGRLFKKKARVNAEKVGFGLRKLIAALPVEEFDIINHSLGAEVTTNLLFNDGAYSSVATPKQPKINVFFIAPAISKKHFKNYLERGSDTISESAADNYVLNILYNHDDRVLSKSGRILGIRIEFSRVYGNTRLGCNCKKDAMELEKRFRKRFPNSSITLFSTESIGGSHHFRSYLGSPEFREMLNVQN